jgi:hypothetical protein
MAGHWLDGVAKALAARFLMPGGRGQDTSVAARFISADEKACYADGGYIVEIGARPVVDQCCICRNVAGRQCPDVAPKMLFAAADRIGRGSVTSIVCLAAGDVPVSTCTPTCRSLTRRSDAPPGW